jgi:hypothetical protein
VETSLDLAIKIITTSTRITPVNILTDNKISLMSFAY